MMQQDENEQKEEMMNPEVGGETPSMAEELGAEMPASDIMAGMEEEMGAAMSGSDEMQCPTQ